MKRVFTLNVSEAEALRLYRILLDKDREDALSFLEEHARKRLHEFLEGGVKDRSRAARWAANLSEPTVISLNWVPYDAHGECATDHAECILGFPGHDLGRMVFALEELTTKAMPRVREKRIYCP